MARKIRSGKTTTKKMSRGEIALYIIGLIVALSMIFGTLLPALGR
jgi:hypothetical protein